MRNGSPPPVPDFPPEDLESKDMLPPDRPLPEGPAPLTPPQQKKLDMEKENQARLSTVVFTEEEIEKIRQATITMFEASLTANTKIAKDGYTEERHDFADLSMGLWYVVNTIEKILDGKKPKICLSKEQKEQIKNDSLQTYTEARQNYKDTTLSGVGKNKIEKLRTAFAMVRRTVGVMIGATCMVLGVSSPFLGKKGKEIVEGIKKKNYAASETVTHVISAVKKSGGRSMGGK